jgi:hypothetical protein
LSRDHHRRQTARGEQTEHRPSCPVHLGEDSRLVGIGHAGARLGRPVGPFDVYGLGGQGASAER